MRQFSLLILLLLATTSCAPILGASHHHPQQIWDTKTAAWDDNTPLPLDQPPTIAQVPGNRYIVVRFFEDEILAPTGVYLSSEEKAFTPTTEMYYTPQMSAKMFDYFTQWMARAGARAYSQYDHAKPEICKDPKEGPDARILQIYIKAGELHRWMYKSGAVADLMRITYRYQWSGCDGKAYHTSRDITHDLLTASQADELDIAAGMIAKEVLSKL